jgi:hypothetical protein
VELAWALLVVVPLLIIEGVALFHLLFRRRDLGVAGKAAWAAGILLVPFVGVLAYALLRKPGLASGKATGPDQDASSTMDRLRALTAAHASASMDDAAYAEAKAELFGL